MHPSTGNTKCVDRSLAPLGCRLIAAEATGQWSRFLKETFAGLKFVFLPSITESMSAQHISRHLSSTPTTHNSHELSLFLQLIRNNPGLAVRLSCVVCALGPGAEVACALVVMATHSQLTSTLWAGLESTKHHPISTAVQDLWQNILQVSAAEAPTFPQHLTLLSPLGTV